MKELSDLIGAGPVLPVPDVHAAVLYYRDVLGFNVDFVNEPPNHGAVRRCHVGVQFMKVPQERVRTGYDGCTYIFVANADQLFGELKRKGVRITRALENQMHGMREFEIEDLYGHRLRFGQYL